MAGYPDHVRRVVSAPDFSHLRHVITDGFYSKRTFLQGLCDLGLEQIGKLRLDANLQRLPLFWCWRAPAVLQRQTSKKIQFSLGGA